MSLPLFSLFLQNKKKQKKKNREQLNEVKEIF